MPHLVQLLTYLNPLRYFVTVLREIFLEGGSARFLLNEILSLTAFAVVIISLSVMKFQKRVS